MDEAVLHRTNAVPKPMPVPASVPGTAASQLLPPNILSARPNLGNQAVDNAREANRLPDLVCLQAPNRLTGLLLRPPAQ